MKQLSITLLLPLLLSLPVLSNAQQQPDPILRDLLKKAIVESDSSKIASTPKSGSPTCPIA